ncbi:MAG: bifunctional UDP-N-acetylmuramoyl-tripeptide:D-alanyl-D-alanine ligase/alanine racemase [Bacteroidota bacterium]
MLQYSLEYISRITQSKLLSARPETIVSSVHTDSRSVFHTQQSLFLALPGNVHNGHDFIEDVYNKNCRVFWVQKNQLYPIFDDAHYIISENVLYAFQQLCGIHRNHFTSPLVGITGSNGKTIVKEWLFHILSEKFSVVRSPKSYNSQIGVPLSLSLLSDNYNCALIEAGISQKGEMEKLAKIVNPTVGIFTNIGDAHQENFSTYTEKIHEKLRLFESVTDLIYCADYQEINEAVEGRNFSAHLYSWSVQNKGTVAVSYSRNKNHGTDIYIEHNTFRLNCTVPFVDRASLENIVHVCIAARLLGVEDISSSVLQSLPQVEMRLEQKQGIKNCTLINDSYNSDFQSIKIALEFLSQQHQHQRTTVILSDVQQTGVAEEMLYADIFDLIEAYGISRFIGIGPRISKYSQQSAHTNLFFESTEQFLAAINSIEFSDEVILLKGARNFAFERIAQFLELQTHRTVLEINLRAMIDNLNYFRSHLSSKTKIVVMVKAFSYGSGSFEIANILQHQRVDYLAVAFVDEGIQLRKAGITLPIIVMNPEITAIKQAFEYDLEIEVYNYLVLNEVLQISHLFSHKDLGIHVKFDTGMVRYGFHENDIDLLIQKIQKKPYCTVRSVFSHLVGADDEKFDSFTLQQIESFTHISRRFISAFDYHIDTHILNSAGIERFSSYQFDMVRLGIGLYGISALQHSNVRPISSLKTHITHIQEIDAGTTIGYSRKGVAGRKARIAVLPLGYADGLRRQLSNGVGTVLIHGKEVPIIGNICMDATMVDVTDVSAQIGDEVVVFDENHSIQKLAEKMNTIPYEVITGISQRVKRIYYYE